MIVNASAAESEWVIAHRGASFDAPENTTAAIALALERGAKIVEFDVRETKDGELFLCHDEDLKRLCGTEQMFSKLNAAEVRKLDVSSWFAKSNYPDETPPTLRSAIQQCIAGGAVPLIEHKTGKPETYAQIITGLNAVDQVIVQSFNWSFISAIRKLLPTVKIGALGSKQLGEHKTELLEMKPDWVGWNAKDISADDISWLKEKGFHIAIWTVNDPVRARELMDQGADKIITDRPKFLTGQIKP